MRFYLRSVYKERFYNNNNNNNLFPSHLTTSMRDAMRT